PLKKLPIQMVQSLPCDGVDGHVPNVGVHPIAQDLLVCMPGVVPHSGLDRREPPIPILVQAVLCRGCQGASSSFRLQSSFFSPGILVGPFDCECPSL